MRTVPSRSGNVLRGPLQERNYKGRRTKKTQSSHFDTLVARYYPAVYGFASQLIDDPREAIALTRDAFNSTRKRMRSRCDGNVFASVLISSVSGQV
jgi:hypothetical protein